MNYFNQSKPGDENHPQKVLDDEIDYESVDEDSDDAVNLDDKYSIKNIFGESDLNEDEKDEISHNKKYNNERSDDAPKNVDAINRVDYSDEYVDSDFKKSNPLENVSLKDIEELLFPHDIIRGEQKKLIDEVKSAIDSKENLIVHAPTGLGKTAASLSPAVTHILKNNDKNLRLFFLTSRHTQHNIVLETLQRINKKFNLKINASSIIGKRNLCLQPGASTMRSHDFTEFCKLLVEGGKCEFYSRVKDGNGKVQVNEIGRAHV